MNTSPITSTTRLEKPLYVWLARIIGVGIVLISIGANLAVLPATWHQIQHEGNVQDVWYTIQPDGSKTVVYVSSEAAQKGIAIGDTLLNAEDSVGEVGTSFTIHFQRDNLPVHDATFIRKLSDQTALEGMVLGLSQGTSTALALFLSLAPFLIGSLAALLICWLKSDDWMALLTAIALANVLSLPNTNPYIEVFSLLIVPVIFAWFILFPNGKLAPRWSWVLIFFLLPSNIFYSLLNVGILSYDISYAGVWQLVNALSGLGGLGIVGIVVFRYRRLFSPVERQQSKWIIFPLLIGLAPSIILSFFSTSYWNSYQIEQALLVSFVSSVLNTIMTGLMVLGILFSIFKYRLYDVDTLVSRAIVYSSLTGILAMIGFAVVPLINYALTQALGNQSGLLAVLVSALPIAALFNPVRDRLQQAVEHRFKPEEMDFENTFIEFTSELRSLFTVKELSTLLARHAVEQLDIAHASVFLNGQNGQLKHITTIRSDQETTSDPSLDDKTLEKIKKGQLNSPDNNYAQSLVIPLVVPRSRKPSLLGALFLGPRLQGVGYSTAMVKSLKKFGEEVGKAFYVTEMKNNQKQTLLETE